MNVLLLELGLMVNIVFNHVRYNIMDTHLSYPILSYLNSFNKHIHEMVQVSHSLISDLEFEY